MRSSFEGGCLCGAVRFRVGGPLREAGYCHCTRCQRRTGTAASANVSVDGVRFELLSGAELVRGWRHPSGGFEKCFCAGCGAHLFSRNPDDPSQMGIRLGAFDADPGVELTYRQFVAYAAPWEPLPEDGLRRFPESRRRS
ncbi:MAG TPA: GFA family protein [Solirubrobacteraceae bacterium]|nr:GFA family protein [Solirubrobacteraceae bacterium]